MFACSGSSCSSNGLPPNKTLQTDEIRPSRAGSPPPTFFVPFGPWRWAARVTWRRSLISLSKPFERISQLSVISVGQRGDTILETLGNLGDFIGGVAVIATLLYLAVQVRQNTASVRAASRTQIVESFRQFNSKLVDTHGLPEVLLQGVRRYPELEQPDRMKFGAYMNDQGLHFQTVFALHESGALEDETYRVYLDFFAAVLATPGGAAFWSEFRAIYPARMSAEVDARLKAGGLPDLLGLPFYQVE